MPIAEAVSGDGTAIVYRVSGPVDGVPMVLVHGWAASLRCWGEVADLLAERFRVIAVDLRGHGYSGTPRSGYDDPENWASDIAAVLAAENVTAGAVLVGWSYGGLVMCDYLAGRGTDAVAGIVLVGAITGVGRGRHGGRVGPAIRNSIPGVYAEKPGTALRAFAVFGDANTGPGEDRGVIAQLMLGTSLSTPPHVREALFTRVAGHDELLRALEIPALIVHGSADPVVDIRSAHYAAEAIPHSTLSIWEGCQHAPFVEDPQRFVAEVTGFVDASVGQSRPQCTMEG